MCYCDSLSGIEIIKLDVFQKKKKSFTFWATSKTLLAVF